MTYTDEDILDLIDHLQEVGAAETLVERSNKILKGLPEETTLKDASEFLTSNGISHTFYSKTYQDIVLNKTGICNWILVQGQTVFFEGAYYSTAVFNSRTIEGIKLDTMSNPGQRFISGTEHSDFNSLPLCTQIQTS